MMDADPNGYSTPLMIGGEKAGEETARLRLELDYRVIVDVA